MVAVNSPEPSASSMTALPDYDPAKDGEGRYLAAIAAKKARGDTHYRKPEPPKEVAG